MGGPWGGSAHCCDCWLVAKPSSLLRWDAAGVVVVLTTASIENPFPLQQEPLRYDALRSISK